MAVFFISCSVHVFFIFHCYIRQEKDGLLSEAVKSFNGALAMDRNQQTAKDHLEKIQSQINLKKEVGGDTYVIFTYFLQNIFPRDTAKRVFQRSILKRKPRNILNLSKQRDVHATERVNCSEIQISVISAARGKACECDSCFAFFIG